MTGTTISSEVFMGFVTDNHCANVGQLVKIGVRV